MLKFTYLVNFGMAGALILPSISQDLSSVGRLEESIRETDRALAQLSGIEKELEGNDYRGVAKILASTEEPFGGTREREALLDRLRMELGELNAKVERIELEPVLPHLLDDPTEELTPEDLSTVPGAVETTGLSDESRSELGNIWPPVISGAPSAVRTEDDRYTFESEGFTVDPVKQGRAYYRAGRYKEALRLFQTQPDNPDAQYWSARSHERLGNTREALASYSAVLESENATAVQLERAAQDRDFLQWLIDFDRKVKDLRGPGEGGE